MIDRKKLSKKLSTNNLNVEIEPFDFKFYRGKIWVKNDCFGIEKEFYIPKRGYYKGIVENVNKNKKEFKENGSNGNEKGFDKFIVRG